MYRTITCTVSDMRQLISGGHKRFLLESPPKTKDDKDFLRNILSLSRKQGLAIFCADLDEFSAYDHLLIQRQNIDAMSDEERIAAMRRGARIFFTGRQKHGSLAFVMSIDDREFVEASSKSKKERDAIKEGWTEEKRMLLDILSD